MQKKEVQNIRVGIFVFLSLVVAAFIILSIGSERRVFEGRYMLKSAFSDISGLRIGAPVQLAGVNVGFVEDIHFPKNLLEKDIIVSLGVAKKYRNRIRQDSVASISTQGLLGDKYIFISIGSPDEPVIKDGGAIKAKETVGLFALAEKGGEIMEDLQKAAKSLSDVLGEVSEGRGDLKQAISSVKNILNKAEKGDGLVHALVYDPKGRQIINDIAATMGSLKDLMNEADTDPEGRKRTKSIVQNLNKVSGNLSEITEKINRGEGTIGGMINDSTIYNEIRSIFGKVNRNALFKTVVRATLEENDKRVLK